MIKQNVASKLLLFFFFSANRRSSPFKNNRRNKFKRNNFYRGPFGSNKQRNMHWQSFVPDKFGPIHPRKKNLR